MSRISLFGKNSILFSPRSVSLNAAYKVPPSSEYGNSAGAYNSRSNLLQSFSGGVFLLMEFHMSCTTRILHDFVFRTSLTSGKHVHKRYAPLNPVLTSFNETWVYKGIPNLVIFAPKHRLWIVRTSSPRLL